MKKQISLQSEIKSVWYVRSPYLPFTTRNSHFLPLISVGKMNFACQGHILIYALYLLSTKTLLLKCVLLLLPNIASSPRHFYLPAPFSLGLPLLVKEGGSHQPLCLIYSTLFPLNPGLLKHVFYYFHILIYLSSCFCLHSLVGLSQTQFKIGAKLVWFSLVLGPSFSKWIYKNLCWNHCDN